MKRWTLSTLGIFCLLLSGIILAETSKEPAGVLLFNAGNAVWEPGGGPGSQRAPIYGDPSKPGAYLQLIKVPPDTANRAHKYSDKRTYTVISGTWYVGFGTRFEKSKLVALGPGSYYALPAGVAVFNATRSDGAVIQIGGTGPTEHIEVETETTADTPTVR